MFKISIEGETLEELASNVLGMAGQFQTTGTAPAAIDLKKLKAHKPAKATVAPAAAEETDDDEIDGELEAELSAPVEPMPETAKGIVDAGTGKPAPAAAATVKMTMDDVRAAAARLSAKDTPKLAEILATYGATKLSEVPKDKLPDFAADIMEVLGQ